jgi:hypothetical protein
MRKTLELGGGFFRLEESFDWSICLIGVHFLKLLLLLAY